MPRPISYAVFCLKKKNAFAMTRARAQTLGISDLDGLARASSSLRLAIDMEFLNLPEWAAVDSRYHPFFFNDTATTEIYTLSLHDALPILLVMVVFFIAFRWIHLSTPLIRLFLLVLILLLMPTLNFLPVWFALSLLRFRLPSRLQIGRASCRERV